MAALTVDKTSMRGIIQRCSSSRTTHLILSFWCITACWSDAREMNKRRVSCVPWKRCQAISFFPTKGQQRGARGARVTAPHAWHHWATAFSCQVRK